MSKENDTDWWWVDYIEGEFAPEMVEDLKKLMRFSKTNRSLVRDLEFTRALVQSYDPAHDVLLEQVDWDKLHKNIMKQFDKESEDEEWKKQKKSTQSRWSWQ